MLVDEHQSVTGPFLFTRERIASERITLSAVRCLRTRVFSGSVAVVPDTAMRMVPRPIKDKPGARFRKTGAGPNPSRASSGNSELRAHIRSMETELAG